MADLNGGFQGLLDSDRPLDGPANGNGLQYDRPLGVQTMDNPENGNDLFAWAQTLELENPNLATELSQSVLSPLDRSHYFNEDAYYEIEQARYHGAFSFEDQSQLYTEPSDELYAAPLDPYPGFIHPGSLQIDPQLVSSGMADMEIFPGLFDTPETNMFLPLMPEEPLSSPKAESSSAQERRTSLRKRKHANPMDNLNSKIIKPKEKGLAAKSPSFASPQLITRLTSKSLYPRTTETDYDNLQSITGPDGHLYPILHGTSIALEPISPHLPIYESERYPDSDETVELEDYSTPYHSRSPLKVSCIAGYLAKAPAPPQNSNENAAASSGDSDNNQNRDNEVENCVVKRGRGRPIVPGSKRQRRIIAMSQPDYVPPKRGRPRTSERHHRKRSRRAKAAFKKPIQTLGNVPEDDIVVEDVAQDTYTPIDLNDELGYKPVYYILSVAQAEKIQQMYRVPAPRQGWSQEERWRLTYNLCRITPTGESLHRRIEMLTAQVSNTNRQNKENDEPEYLDADAASDTERQEPSNDIFFRPSMVPKPIFPDYRLQVVVDGAQREMSLHEVLHKLKDERDVLFRAIVWEIYKNSNFIGEMEFTGTLNKTTKTWEFF
ncbi:hypothetical protein TWF694_002925 [Orbilia ellipsospora]|uniref:Uncharacterized protein n=1 Tax=Orbilia ellipsospora TaxID=2528407 RepID=A0AAV9X2E9_9PEZI